MSQSLDSLLNSIAPPQTIMQIRSRVDNAINTFSPARNPVQNQEQFNQLLIQFTIHIDQHLAGASSPRPEIPVYDYARCIEIMQQLYGPNGIQKAFHLARGGYEGGLRSVLNEFAMACAGRVIEASIGDKVSNFCWGLSQQDCPAVAQAIIGRFGRFLPPEWLEGGGRKLAANLERMLKQLPHILLRARDIR